MTKSQRMRLRAVMISSTMPSTKYSCSGSPDMFWNGNTAIEGLSGKVSGGWTAGMPAGGRRSDFVSAYRPSDVLEVLFAQIFEGQIEPAGRILLHPRRNAD